MGILYMTIILSTALAILFLCFFIWSVRDGQYEDDKSPAVSMLLEDELEKENQEN